MKTKLKEIEQDDTGNKKYEHKLEKTRTGQTKLKPKL